jgi:3-isopropylmalate dehydrogenase
MKPTLAVLPGDGIGPEVIDAALVVLQALVPVEARFGLVGGSAIEQTGSALPEDTLALCHGADAVLLGAVGGPRWDAGRVRPEAGLLGLRQALGLYANLRPARHIGLPTPLREDLVQGADVLIVRELSSGVYFGTPREQHADMAFNTWRQSADEVRAVGRVAFEAARARRGRVTSVDKANVLEASRLWRGVMTELAKSYPDVTLEHRYVDALSFELLQRPRHFDVIVADNLFGDILSDEAGALVGSLGVLPSASLGPGPGLFEPVHGSAPDIAHTGKANPVGAILTVALLLEHGLGQGWAGRAVELAVEAALRDERTPDLGGSASTASFTRAVLRHLEWTRFAAREHELEVASANWGV